MSRADIIDRYFKKKGVREMNPEQRKRVAEIAAKACLEFGVNYDGVSFAAEEAILAALADPLLDGREWLPIESTPKGE